MDALILASVLKHRGVELSFVYEVVETLESSQGTVIWCKGVHFLGLLVPSFSAEPPSPCGRVLGDILDPLKLKSF